jgi:large exoprotein involved in heme utilization and adhesion
LKSGIYSETGNSLATNAQSTGKAGEIDLHISDQLSLIRGGQISSSSFGTGDAGKITVNAGQLLVDRQGALTDNLGNPLQTGIFTATERAWSGSGNDLSVAVQGDIDIKAGGEISASTRGGGNAGDVHVKAKNLSIDGQTILNGKKSYIATRIASTAGSGNTPDEKTGNSGNITVDIANRLSLIGGGQIGASSFSMGDAGRITVNAGQLLIDGQDALLFKDSLDVPVQTGIFTAAGKPWSGKGNDLIITIKGDINMKSGGVIGASTHGRKDAGNIRITASNLIIDGHTIADGQTDTPISSIAVSDSTSDKTTGNAGNITVDVANLLSLLRGGRILSSTFGTGHAGEISVTAGRLLVDAQDIFSDDFLGSSLQTGIFTAAEKAWSGRGNDLSVAVHGDIDIKAGGEISASTRGGGNAGDIFITAKNLKLENESQINATTQSSGKAGDVVVETGRLLIDSGSRISAEALTGSEGETGNVKIDARDSIILSHQGKISIENAGFANTRQITAGSLALSAPNIFLNNGQITTNSKQDINAGAIQVNFANQLFLNRKSSISTEANNGNGGNIDIRGGQMIQLINSGFTTSVLGQQSGNGGDINVTAESLVMETGLIQANTKAPDASGGDINLRLSALIPSGETLILGGDQPIDNWKPYEFGFNVIQAAAPNGVSGLIQSTAPQLNLSGILSNLGGPQFDTSVISQDYCALGTGSSLIRQGKGGLLPRSRDSVMY